MRCPPTSSGEELEPSQQCSSQQGPCVSQAPKDGAGQTFTVQVRKVALQGAVACLKLR